MKAILVRLALLLALLWPTGPVAATDLLRRGDRKDAAKPESARKDVKREKDAKPRPQIEIIKNISYRNGDDADAQRHQLDLYLPRGKKNFPVIFFVHGGSWKSGNKDEYVKLGELFAGEGLGFVISNYRLSPKVQHPAHIEDVAAAFAWTIANIERYGGRNDQVFACGHSAGGHLVALLGTDEKYLKQKGLKLADVRGVIAISGVFEINPLLPMFRNTFGKDKDDCRAASPITHAKEGRPPFLILYADNDLPFLGKMALDMSEALKKNKCDAECQKIQHRNHMSILMMLSLETDTGRQAVAEFITKHSDWKPPSKPEAAADDKRETRRRDGKNKDDK